MCDVPALEVLWLGLCAGEQERGVGGDPYPVKVSTIAISTPTKINTGRRLPA
jgi:hypothetical protein